MEFIFVWMLFGLATGIVANKKGRSGCAWFVLGVLTGPLGLLIALVVAEDRQEMEKASLEEGGLKKCPYCAELIRSEAVKCRYCGSEVPKSETGEMQASDAERPADGPQSAE